MRESVPPRLTWAVELLPRTVRGAILEIGCGGGHAAALLLERYPSSEITALDRSDLQIRGAGARLREYVDAGRLRLAHASLDDAPAVLGRGRFEVALAVNVNAFWTTPAKAFQSAGALLAPKGRLYLVYDPPGARQVRALQAKLETAMAKHGFRGITARSRSLPRSALLGVWSTWSR